MLTNNEVTLLKDFIDWQSLPFKEDVIFTSYEQQIKAFEKWLLSGKTVAFIWQNCGRFEERKRN